VRVRDGKGQEGSLVPLNASAQRGLNAYLKSRELHRPHRRNAATILRQKAYLDYLGLKLRQAAVGEKEGDLPPS
jgi:hypothetical protein